MELHQKHINLILELGFEKERLDTLQKYAKLLWTENQELNLFSRQLTKESLIENHLIDCLLPLPLFPPNLSNVADFGSGGGMPGVLYAIQFPEISFHLFEKSPKKRQFLEKCRSIAPNLRIQGNIPPLIPDIKLITARAFKPIDVILNLSRKHLDSGGKYFLLKGRAEKIQEELALAQKQFKNLKVDIESLKSPLLDVERHLVLIEKK